ncbi:MAG: hypothetical protein KDA28_06675, partial [Phycisphaerales bacterium]|nr:hypothetical protein [Phycisphaerales bacterium]
MRDVSLSIDCDPHLNLAMQQNEVPVIKRVRVVSDADEALFDLLLRIECPGASPYERRIAALPPGGSVVLDDIHLDLDRAWLAALLERERHTLEASIRHGETELHTCRCDLDVLAFNEWGGARTLPEIAGAFSLPNHPAIGGVIERARAVCRASAWSDAFTGYRQHDARRQVHAIWEAIRGLDIGYVLPPASFEQHGQKIRLPEQIVEHRQATCLDLTFLFCGALEQVGLAPLLLLRKEHAWVGVWLQDETFPSAMIDDPAALRKRIDLSEMVALETTLATSGGTFDEACERGRRHLDESDFEFAVDIRASRRVGIRPLPVRAATSYSLFDDEAASATDTLVEPRVTIAPPLPLEADPEEATPAGRLDGWKRRLLD